MFSNLKIVTIFVVVLLSGCAAQGEKFSGFVEPNNNNAVIYLFRQSSFVGGAYCPNVNVNGQYYGCLKMDGYFRIEIPSGKNEICFCKSIMEIGNNLKLDMDLKAGEVRYFEWVPHVGGMAVIGDNVVPTGGQMESIVEHPKQASLKMLSNFKLSR